MKNMKKLASLILAVVMVLALATTAFAADDTFTIKLTGTTASPTSGHYYDVYQIFTGTLATNEDGAQFLSNVKYGANYTPGESRVGDLVSDNELAAIIDANAFADKLVDGELLDGAAIARLDTTNGWTKSGVPAGYYLILDVTDPLPEGQTRSAYIVQVVKDVDMAPKSSVVEVVKKLKDINDSQDGSIDDNAWTDSADHDVNDIIPYQIKSSINAIGEFVKYPVTFLDTMSKGLTYNNDAVITLDYTYLKADGTTGTGTKDVTSSFSKTEAAYAGEEEKYEGGKVYTFANDDIKALITEGNMIDATITIEYTATLNENAYYGEPGNPNKVNMKYDREPEPDKYDEGTTPDDTCIVFTFKTDVNKVDQDKKPLTGAEFKLEKFVASDDGTVTYKNVTGEWETLTLVKNDDGTTFSFKGLDDGEYRITETQTPAGYNPIDPIYFTVTAEHTVDPAALQLTELNAAAVKSDGSSYTDAEKATGNVASFTVTKADGDIVTDVVNNSGALLPETGGIGTTIFYALGGILVLAAIVLLVTKKRMSAES